MSERAIALAAIGVGTSVLLGSSASATQGWQVVEPMPVARSYHAGAAVGNRWYVAGGASWFGTGSGERFPAEVHVYDPTSGHWAVLGRLEQGREFMVAAADHPHARVIFPGGFLPTGPDAYLALATCDIAAHEGVMSAPSLLGARHLHAVTVANGKFIASGGWGMGGASSKLLDDAEVWNGNSATWSGVGRMPGGPIAAHTMTTLQNGREVLVVGGCRPDGSRAEVALFDVECSRWKSVEPLNVSRCSHRAVLLDDGRVLVAGGGNSMKESGERSAEIFDPSTEKWTVAAPMNDGRYNHDMVVLPDGRVLVAGGTNNQRDGEYGALNSAEVYDPSFDTWTPIPPMHDRRRWPTVAVLSDGVYVAGGSFSLSTVPGSAVVLASVERLAWSALGIAPIDLDAGVTDVSPSDAATSCVSEDASVGSEGAADASAPDAGPSDDAASDTSADDAAPSDRDPGGGKSGCSCTLHSPLRAASSDIVLAWCAVFAGVCLQRRRRRPSTRGGPDA